MAWDGFSTSKNLMELVIPQKMDESFRLFECERCERAENPQAFFPETMGFFRVCRESSFLGETVHQMHQIQQIQQPPSLTGTHGDNTEDNTEKTLLDKSKVYS